MAQSVDLADAGTRIPDLVRLALCGEEILLTDRGATVARLLPPETEGQPRTPGLGSGAVWMSEDFDAPLPDEFWTGSE